MENLQIDMNRLQEWAVENEMIINPSKSKAICFMKIRVLELLNYSLQDEAGGSKQL
jgi:aminopeptidase-like protein